MLNKAYNMIGFWQEYKKILPQINTAGFSFILIFSQKVYKNQALFVKLPITSQYIP